MYEFAQVKGIPPQPPPHSVPPADSQAEERVPRSALSIPMRSNHSHWKLAHNTPAWLTERTAWTQSFQRKLQVRENASESPALASLWVCLPESTRAFPCFPGKGPGKGLPNSLHPGCLQWNKLGQLIQSTAWCWSNSEVLEKWAGG